MENAEFCVISDNRDFVVLSGGSCCKCFEISQKTKIVKKFKGLKQDDMKMFKDSNLQFINFKCKKFCQNSKN